MRKIQRVITMERRQGAKSAFQPPGGRALLGAFLLLVSVSCATRSQPGVFRVLPDQPVYILRSPDSENIPFPEVLSRSGHAGRGWVQLLPRMGLRIENAYYRDLKLESTRENFLGTEIAQYQVRPRGGLRLRSVESGLTQRPSDQPAVQELIPASERRHRHHRLFFQIGVKQRGNTKSAILLGAESIHVLDRLTEKLISEPESVCGFESSHCVVFPESCTVSPEIEVTVNGSTRAVLWGATLRSIAAHASHVEVLRLHGGQLTPVEMDSSDPDALHLPLLPGDRIHWR
jgi:hypothetical protein